MVKKERIMIRLKNGFGKKETKKKVKKLLKMFTLYKEIKERFFKYKLY